MKYHNPNLAIIILLISFQTVYAQNITSDTILAKKYFETAKEYYNNKSYDTAIINFEKASVLFKKHEQWRKYLQISTKQADSYSELWQPDKAIGIIREGIKKTLLHIDENDSIVADAFHVLGIQYYYKSDIDSALFFWKKTLNIRESVFGKIHPDIAKICLNIGIIYFHQDKHDISLKYYLKSLHISKKVYGEYHILVQKIYIRMTSRIIIISISLFLFLSCEKKEGIYFEKNTKYY